MTDHEPPSAPGAAPASSGRVAVELLPLGRTLWVQRGAAMRDILFDQGVEFPCGGRGRCKGCRVRVLRGVLWPSEEDLRLLSPAELADGWRLACRARVQADVTLDLAQWETPILADDTPFAFTPREGLGVAVDLGTTTVVAQLLDLETGRVLGVRSALNPQARHGADIMSRIDFALAPEGQATLARLARDLIGGMVAELLSGAGAPPERLRDVVVAGNTVMHHLFCGVPVLPLSRHPFEPEEGGARVFEAAALGWTGAGASVARFLPVLGGFVGSDILAGIMATRLHERDSLNVLVDLGTNGEIVVGNRQRMLCASTAAGPAFEGARISMGMRAATGAISEVRLEEGRMRCGVLGQGAPRGLCGSGLVDAVACALDLGWIQPSGRVPGGRSIPVAAPVELTQGDVRELQLAKGAISAGLRILLRQWGAAPGQVETVYLAGAFGNYISKRSAARIGLIDFPPDRVRAAGNTALLGAKLALFNLRPGQGYPADLPGRVAHVPLNDDPEFQDVFAEEMGFPPAGEGGIG